MNKSLVKGLIKGCILIILMIVILKSLDPIFRETKVTIWDHFYEQDNNDIDILILGNSHINTGVDIDLLNARLKINSISLATKGQNIYQAYYAALEAYNYQVPEILIIENYLFYERLTLDGFVNLNTESGDYLKRYLTFEGKKISSVKLEESKAFLKGNVFENMFSVVKKHDRWTDVDRLKNRILETKDNLRHRGTSILNESAVKQYENQSKFGLDEYNILSDELNYLNRIVELAKRKGTKKIILLTVPFYNIYRNKINYSSLDDPLTNYSTDNEFVDYIDLNKEFPDWDRSYFSNDPVGYNQHLNYKGAIRSTNFLADYIRKNHKFQSKVNTNSIEDNLYCNGLNQIKPVESDSLIGFFRMNNSKNNEISVKQEEQFVEINGWMAIKDVRAKGNEMYVALVRDQNFVYINTANQLIKKKRQDVTKNLNKTGDFYDDSGFEIDINSLLLEKGTYQVYTIIQNKTGVVYIKNSGKRIKIV